MWGKIRIVNNFYILMLVIASVFLLVLTNNKLHAQGGSDELGNGLRISPVTQEITIEPGAKDTIEVIVTNVTAFPLILNTEINDFISDNETGDPVIIVEEGDEDTQANSIRNYIAGPFEKIKLQPGQEKAIKYTIDVPKDATPGAHYGIIRYEAVIGGDSDQQGVSLNASAGPLIFVNIPGNIVELISVDYIGALNVDGSPGKFFDSAPQEMGVRLHNDGNSLVKPYGTVVVKDWRNNEIQRFEFNAGEQERRRILPDSYRTFKNNLENIGSIGRYTIESNISYGDGGNIINAKATFWVIPWKIILLIIVVIIALFFFFTRGIRAYNRRIIRKSKTSHSKQKR